MNDKKDIYDIDNSQDQAIDEPDFRDYEYTEIYWDIAGTPVESEFNKKLRLALSKEKFSDAISYLQSKQQIENQYTDQETKKSCTRQGIINVVNSQNLLKYLVEDLDYTHLSAKPMRLEHEEWRYKLAWVEKWTLWSSLQSALQQAKDKNHTAWYAKAMTVNNAIDAINRQHFIYTGSNNGNWSQIWAGWMYKRRTDWKIVWHAFAWAVAYDLDRQFFWAIDSSWRKFFKIPFSEWNTLYTRYAIIDRDDEKLAKYKASKVNKKDQEKRQWFHRIFLATIERNWIMRNNINDYPWITQEELTTFRENTEQRANIMRELMRRYWTD